MSSLKELKVEAILGEEFNRVLDKLGVKDDFESGKYQCRICGDQVTADNVLLVFPVSENEVGFICRKQSCVMEYKFGLKK